MKNKVALIFGISGQDGSYLAKHLLEENYEVHGTSRQNTKCFDNHRKLFINKKCKIYKLKNINNKNIYNLIKKIKPHEIYNLAGESSVANSFKNPLDTFEEIFNINLFIIDNIKKYFTDIKYFNACSSECFGNKKPFLDNNQYIFDPLSPYAVAKSSTFYSTKFYRDQFKLKFVSGIMYNHESPLRKKHFLTKKIVQGLIDIKNGKKNYLTVGNIYVERDWGYAPEYVVAMHSLLKKNKFDDFIIATGKNHSVKYLISKVSQIIGLDIEWKGKGVNEYAYCKSRKKKIIIVSKKLYRPAEVQSNKGNISKIVREIGWKPKVSFNKMLKILIKDELENTNV